MRRKKDKITKAQALVCIEVLMQDFVCCKEKDYEAGCISCDARRIAKTLKDLVNEGEYV